MVVVERALDDVGTVSVPTVTNAIHLTSAPPSPTPSTRNVERQDGVQRNGGHRGGYHGVQMTPRGTPRCQDDVQRNGGHRGVEADQSKKFITRFNFGLRRVRSAARRNKKSSDHPRVGGAHNAQKRERKATKTLAIVLGRSSTPDYSHHIN